MFDTHCHLDAAIFKTHRNQVVAEALEVGVRHLLVPSIGGVNNWAELIALKAQYATYIALGFHPLYTRYLQSKDLVTLETWIERVQPVAIGEIGLDCQAGSPNLADQEKLLKAQLILAKRYHLPVILHTQGAIDPVLKILRILPPPSGIFHAFNGSYQQAKQCMDLNFKLGFGSTMTYPRARHISHLVGALPEEALVLETDAPDMRPAWLKTGPSQPQAIAQYAQYMATLRTQSVDQVITYSTRNAVKALQLPCNNLSLLHI